MTTALCSPPPASLRLPEGTDKGRVTIGFWKKDLTSLSVVVVESRAVRILLDARLILAVRNGRAERSAVVGVC